ncbi:NAD(P)-binding protein [Phycicoccus sonneratiae]|uniref:NAD-binding protein n=1 Tax=Phycicoccus sonneratiae TaxID=2807628 RepID=A0ABS2CHI6_9MICO|nr:NAD(P)-binding protein [Phycicoccus sonneraticus]MBM6399331.1 NAD-binding protein [Phycicoccus sonneraticus]
MTGVRRVVVVGDLEVTRVLCALLTGAEVDVVHLLAPDEEELRAALDDAVDAVAVLVRGDLRALRYVLLAEHLAPGVSVVVTVFDRTMARRLAAVVPRCVVTSPADVAAPAVVAACLGADVHAVRTGPDGPRALVRREGAVVEDPWPVRAPTVLERAARWVPHRHGAGSGLFPVGLLGLALTLALEWALGVVVLHEGVVEALRAAAGLVATVGFVEGGSDAVPGWYLVTSAVLMLAGIAFTGALVAGLVEWVVGARTVAVAGPRSLPRRDHVVVSGLGQVGLRVAQLLRELGIGVVVLERDAQGANLALARASRLPVVVGDAAHRALLRRVGLSRARAVAALGSDDLDNVAVAIGALAEAPGVRAVLRAGEGAAVRETTSLFRIGAVVDVAALTAGWVCSCVLGDEPLVAWTEPGVVGVLTGAGERRRATPARCDCAYTPRGI